MYLRLILLGYVSAYHLGLTVVEPLPSGSYCDGTISSNGVLRWCRQSGPRVDELARIKASSTSLTQFTLTEDLTVRALVVGDELSRLSLSIGTRKVTADKIQVSKGSILNITNTGSVVADVYNLGVVCGSGIISGILSPAYPIGSATLATSSWLVPGGDGIGTLTVTGDLVFSYDSVLGMQWVNETLHDKLTINGEIVMACKYCWWLEGAFSNVSISTVIETGSLSCAIGYPLSLAVGPVRNLQSLPSSVGPTPPPPPKISLSKGIITMNSADTAPTVKDVGYVEPSSGSFVADTSSPDLCSGGSFATLLDPCNTVNTIVTQTCRCVNGQCDGSGVCHCDPGYIGGICDTMDCPGYPACSSHGSCVLDSAAVPVCYCKTGWTGPDCSTPICPHLAGQPACSGVGTCLPYDPPVCACPFGYSGAACQLASAACLDCQHGSCQNGTQCICEPGWTGVSCQLEDCPGTPDCSGRGSCASGQCTCAPGYTGPACEVLLCPGSNCSGRGLCMPTDREPVCVCDDGFVGADCSVRSTSCTTANCKQGSCPAASPALTVKNCGADVLAYTIDEELQGVWSQTAQGVEQSAASTGTSHCLLEFGTALSLGYISNASTGLTIQFDFTDAHSIQGITVMDDLDNFWQVLISPSTRTFRVQSVNFGVLNSFGIRLLPSSATSFTLTVKPASVVGYYNVVVRPAGVTSVPANLTVLAALPEGLFGLYSYGVSQFSNVCVNLTGAAAQLSRSTNYHCSCTGPYIGSECSVLDCSALNFCSMGRGTCSYDGANLACACKPGWSGTDCSVPVCANACSGHGSCRAQSASEPLCDCDPNWNSAADCSVLAPKCPGCLQGSCRYDSTANQSYCECNADWTGPQCNIPVCNGVLTSECSGLGTCDSSVVPHVCLCDPSPAVYGPNCEYQDLSLLCPNDCNAVTNNGHCDQSSLLATCMCNPGYGGSACETVVDATLTTTVLTKDGVIVTAEQLEAEKKMKYIIYGSSSGGALLVVVIVAVVGTIFYKRRRQSLNARLAGTTGSSMMEDQTFEPMPLPPLEPYTAPLESSFDSSFASSSASMPARVPPTPPPRVPPKAPRALPAKPPRPAGPPPVELRSLPTDESAYM